MLDLNHPLTQRRFEASDIEDKIRAYLVEWEQALTSGNPVPLPTEVVTRLIPDLHALNKQYFGASAGITRTLNGLSTAITRSDLQESWHAYTKLAAGPGENFGTWAI